MRPGRGSGLGAGAKHRLVFVDRLLATLVHLRHATTHHVIACWFGVDRSTITRAIAEVRPLLAERGCTISQGVRLRTLAEVIDHLGTDGKTGIIDGTEIRVRRPAAGHNDRDNSSPARTSRTRSRPWSSQTTVRWLLQMMHRGNGDGFHEALRIARGMPMDDVRRAGESADRTDDAEAIVHVVGRA